MRLGARASGTAVVGAAPAYAYLAHLQPLLGDDDEAHRRATVTLSAMVGAVMIAPALGPTPGSDEILRDVREAVRERRLL